MSGSFVSVSINVDRPKAKFFDNVNAIVIDFGENISAHIKDANEVELLISDLQTAVKQLKKSGGAS